MLRWRCSRSSKTGKTSPISRTELRASGRRPVRWGSASDLREGEEEDTEAVGDTLLCPRAEEAEEEAEDAAGSP